MTRLRSCASAASASAGAIGESVIGAVCCCSARAYATSRSAEGTAGGALAVLEGTVDEALLVAGGEGDADGGTLHGGVGGAGAAGVGEAESTAGGVEIAGTQGAVGRGVDDPRVREVAAGDASDLRWSRRRMARAAAHSAVRMEAASGPSGEL